jgi:hypothetical protein
MRNSSSIPISRGIPEEHFKPKCSRGPLSPEVLTAQGPAQMLARACSHTHFGARIFHAKNEKTAKFPGNFPIPNYSQKNAFGNVLRTTNLAIA